MAENKEILPNETEVATEEVVQPTEAVEEVAAPAAEPAAVETAPDASKSDGSGSKFKSFFAKIGKTIKGWFVKEQAVATDGDGNPVVLTEEQQRIQAMLEGPQLSKKEKFARFCKSQSGWLFVLPAVILLCIFTFWPIINALYGSLMQEYSSLKVEDIYDGWGFGNYGHVLRGDTGTGGATFLQCLFNTVIFTFISVPVSILLALLISVALGSIKRLQKAYQTILFLPYLTNAVAMGAVFATFFKVIGTPTYTSSWGLVNQVFGLNVNWLDVNNNIWTLGQVNIPWASYVVVILYEIWAGLPFKILILFGALQSVNKQLYDAAKIDGASKNTTLWKITAPMISPMISYLLTTGIMGGMKMYTSVVGLFGNEMGGRYEVGTMVGYVYQFLSDGKTGYAFAASILLFIIIMIITGINNLISKKLVTY